MAEQEIPESWKQPSAASGKARRRWHPMPVLAMSLVVAAVIAGPDVKAHFAQAAPNETGRSYEELVDQLVIEGVIREQSSTERTVDVATAGEAVKATARSAIVIDPQGNGAARWRSHCRADDSLALPRAILGWLTGGRSGDPAACDAMIAAFGAASFLGQDRAAGCDDRLWQCGGGRVRLVSGTRRIRTSDNQDRSRPVIFGDSTEFKLLATQPTTGQSHDLLFVRASGSPDTIRVIDDSVWGQPVDGSAAAWCFGTDDDALCNNGVGFWPVGDRIVMTSKGGEAPSIALDGVPLSSTNLGALAWRFLLPGEQVDIASADRRVTVRLVNQGATIGRVAGLASLESAVAAAVPQGSGPVRTSLNQTLHEAVQAMLDAHLMPKLRARRGTSFRASVTMMDARSGEIAALPTFPHNIEQLHPAEQQSGRRINWVNANVNFARMPIGSAAKIPFAAAAIAADPGLAEGERCIGGWAGLLLGDRAGVTGRRVREMRAEGADPCARRMGLAQFVARSNNDYALDLMYRMLPPRGDFAWSDDPAAAGNQQQRFLRYLWALGCVVPVTRGTDGNLGEGWQGSEGCAPTLWPEVAFGNATAARLIEPDPVFLGFGDLNQNSLTGDYFMSILGGSRSTWSTITLAQAYARIVTGTPVQARLIAGATPPVSAAWQQELGRWSAARDTLRSGMRGVTQAGGTAASLQAPASYDGLELSYFAKTGTSDVDVFSVSASGGGSALRDAIAAAIAARCPVYISDDPVTPQIDVSVGRGGCAALRDRVLASAHAGGRAAMRPLYDARDRSTGRLWALPDLTRVTTDQGHSFAFVVEVRRPGASAPCATSAIAINIQHRIKGSDAKPSVVFASQLLGNATVLRWLTARCAAR